MFKKFNINEHVKVKLTKEGIAELKRQHDELYSHFPKVERHKFIHPSVDSEGYTTFQMWDLMSQLGHMMQFGFSNHGFETDILIDIKEGE